MIPLYDSIFYWVEDSTKQDKKRTLSIKKKTKTTWSVMLTDEYGLQTYALHHNLETAIGIALSNIRQLEQQLKANQQLVY